MKPGGKHKRQTGKACAPPVPGAPGAHGITAATGGGLMRLTVARIVEFTNTNDVATVDTTNWFLLIKNLFSLEL
jgi:hypothetical protein